MLRRMDRPSGVAVEVPLDLASNRCVTKLFHIHLLESDFGSAAVASAVLLPQICFRGLCMV